MISLLFALIVFGALVRILVKRGLPPGRPRSPIEPGGRRPALPKPDDAGQPAIRDGKATVETLMDDYAEGRISVEEYEHRLDEIYRNDLD